jgi:hypothetical protein
MKHKSQCNKDVCYCLDEELGHQMCSHRNGGCGHPSFDCCCFNENNYNSGIDPDLDQLHWEDLKIAYHPSIDGWFNSRSLSERNDQPIETIDDADRLIIEIKNKVVMASIYLESQVWISALSLLREIVQLLASLQMYWQHQIYLAKVRQRYGILPRGDIR